MDRSMSGAELTANLKALKPALKVIYTTGYSREAADHNLELEEGRNFLPKPHTPETLLNIAHAQLGPEDPTHVLFRTMVCHWQAGVRW